jgi:putative addiction module component (TIGR02574 family)
MPKRTLSPPPGFDELSVPEQIEYVQGLWEQIVTSSEAVSTPDWHLDIIRRRLQDFEQNPQAGRSWQEVREDIEQQIRARQSG